MGLERKEDEVGVSSKPSPTPIFPVTTDAHVSTKDRWGCCFYLEAKLTINQPE